MTNEFSEMDDLLAPATTHLLQQRRLREKAAERRSIKPAEEIDRIEPRAIYLDPENWERTRGVALVHADTQTLLGNFSEYRHRSVVGARKLVRESAPISVSATESVSGSWWLGADRRPEPAQVWHEARRAIVHLHLSELHVHAPACEVLAHLSYGGIARVELAADTQLAQEDGHGEQLLFLPKGSNVLEVMSRDCKITLRQEIGL